MSENSVIEEEYWRDKKNVRITMSTGQKFYGKIRKMDNIVILMDNIKNVLFIKDWEWAKGNVIVPTLLYRRDISSVEDDWESIYPEMIKSKTIET